MPETTPALKPDALAAVVDTDNPWPGLLSFEESNEDFFRGRDLEKRDLLRMVLRERAAVLYGVSGLGKTSLVQAGLFPLARREAMLPITIRFDFLPGAPDLVQQIKTAILAPRKGFEVPRARTGESLWEYFHRQGNEFWGDRLVMPLLVFDQFEELFTTGAGIEPVLEQLADLAAGSPPEDLRRRMDANPELTRDFQFEHHHYRMLFSIREDYFASMEPLFRKVRGLELHRFQLLPMNGVAAREVVDQAPQLVDSGVAEKIVRVVAAAETSPYPPETWSVEPALLSLLCRELNERRKREGLARITEELLVGNRDGIFSDFYENSMLQLAPPIREFVEEKLLTDSGQRNSEPIDNLPRYGLTEESLKPLVVGRLIHIGQWGTSRRVEISHDRLTGVVRISRDRRRERVAREQAERARHEAEFRETKAREELRKSRRTTMVYGLLAAFCVVLLAVAAGAWWFAAKERDKALQAKKQAAEEYEKRLGAEGKLSQAQRDGLEQNLRAKLAQEAVAGARDREIQRERGLNLSERGWGVIFATGADKRLATALRPLLERRKRQAGDQYRELVLKADESAGKMVARFKSSARGSDPNLPQYLLLVGCPEEVPFNFQYELGTQYAVGRLCFEQTAEYRSYAESVIRAEDAAPRETLRALVFATKLPAYLASELLYDQLIKPLEKSFSNDPKKWSRYDWSMQVTKPDQAVKAMLLRELASRAPDLLFTAVPTANYPKGNTLQRNNTGALIDGRFRPGQPPAPDMLVTAADIPANADMTGSMVLCFGSYGGGMSRQDEFVATANGQLPAQSDEAIVAKLPMRLLGNRKGGALAFVGHVDRNWASSFTGTSGAEPEAFFGFLRRVMDGGDGGAGNGAVPRAAGPAHFSSAGKSEPDRPGIRISTPRFKRPDRSEGQPQLHHSRRSGYGDQC